MQTTNNSDAAVIKPRLADLLARSIEGEYLDKSEEGEPVDEDEGSSGG
jgi:hypothetical protein